MNVVRGTGQDFVVRVTLSGNAEFATATAGGNLPTLSDIELDPAKDGGGTITTTVVNGGKNGDTFVDFFVAIDNPFSSFPNVRIDMGAGSTGTEWAIRDPDNVLAAGSISATVQTFNAADNIEFDIGTPTSTILTGKAGVATGKDAGFIGTTATIDVRTGRLEIVPKTNLNTADDDSSNDNGATVGIDTGVSGVLDNEGNTYSMKAADKVNIVIEGDLSGIDEIVWNSDPTGFTFDGVAITLKSTDAGFDITNGVATIELDGSRGELNGENREFTVTVDGSTVLNPRTLTVVVQLDFTDTLGGLDANDRDLVDKTNFTVWNLNGTILIANFMNGNNAIFNGRIYLFNPSSDAGGVAVRVFTLPLSGTSVQLGSGTLDLGDLQGTTGRNIRLAEDVLTPLGIAVPYIADGGNIVVEITIEAAGVTGVGQVFQLDLSSFGIYPLSRVGG